METYASLSLNSINYFSPANTNVFPRLCNAAGYTDVDAYCASGTSELCCGLCINQSVAGVGQFVWAIISYGITAFSYTLSPSAVWGLAIMQLVNAFNFVGTGFIRMGMGAVDGGMTRFHLQFLYPQALGFIFIMAPATFAPHWSRLGGTHQSMLTRIHSRFPSEPNEPTRDEARTVELSLIKDAHSWWAYGVFVMWFCALAVWSALYVWVSQADIEFSQANCEEVIVYTLSPTGATIILGSLAWVLLAIDTLVIYHKQGASDLIIDRLLKPKNGRVRTFDEHRRLERKITIGVTIAMFVVWLVVNCWLYIDGMNRFLLSGADSFTFGQVEQLTALFPDLLGFVAAVASYLESRNSLRSTKKGFRSAIRRRKGKGMYFTTPFAPTTSDEDGARVGKSGTSTSRKSEKSRRSSLLVDPHVRGGGQDDRSRLDASSSGDDWYSPGTEAGPSWDPHNVRHFLTRDEHLARFPRGMLEDPHHHRSDYPSTLSSHAGPHDHTSDLNESEDDALPSPTSSQLHRPTRTPSSSSAHTSRPPSSLHIPRVPPQLDLPTDLDRVPSFRSFNSHLNKQFGSGGDSGGRRSSAHDVEDERDERSLVKRSESKRRKGRYAGRRGRQERLSEEDEELLGER
ncbi:hypothetical protein JCM10213_003209 [Rhodosporidiobolus nylandii]